jgi:hypothetical protein
VKADALREWVEQREVDFKISVDDSPSDIKIGLLNSAKMQARKYERQAQEATDGDSSE